MKQLPKRFKKFQKDFPEVAKAYEELGTAVHKSAIINEYELRRSYNLETIENKLTIISSIQM